MCYNTLYKQKGYKMYSEDREISRYYDGNKATILNNAHRNKQLETGSKMCCAVCGESIIKKNHLQLVCSTPKSADGKRTTSRCKKTYNNMVRPEERRRRRKTSRYYG